MSGSIIEVFLNNKTIEFDYLFKIIERKYGIEIYELFIPSLSLLYCLGKINYIVEEDLLEWRNED